MLPCFFRCSIFKPISDDPAFNNASSTSCESCKVGEKADPGSVKCTSCDAGEAGPGANGVCEKCAAGQFRRSNDLTTDSCTLCGTGYYQTERGQASCFPCSPGKFSSSGGSTTCDKCPHGYLQSEPQQSTCDKVQAGGSTSVIVPDGSKFDSSDPSGFKVFQQEQ